MEYQWIDINEYSRIFEISISTIRRRIKSSKLESQKKNGKYLIKVLTDQLIKKDTKKNDSNNAAKMENEKLKKRIKILKQEIQDFKILIDIYENKKFVLNQPSGKDILRREKPPAILR
ncbi:MAG: hypothetical protein OXB88_03315 [Bacteriovoracales bacterium]|nr:hypothetical protein [Bacteriovoracales bacterium]